MCDDSDVYEGTNLSGLTFRWFFSLKYPVGTRVLYTHKKYSISYNGPHIIHVNLTYSDVLTSIASNKCVQSD